MPSGEKSPQEIDVALRILDIVTPRINFGNEMDIATSREITQTDHLNKRLLKTFLDRINIINKVPTVNNSEEDDNYQDFDD